MDRKRVRIEEEDIENPDIRRLLQVLANGITDVQASLVKPKERKPNLKDIDEKLNIIIQILKSWDTSSTECLNLLTHEDAEQDVLQNQI